MNRGAPTLRKSPTAHQILAYLVDHPEAQDTVEGIVEWWLLEQHIKHSRTQVKAALEHLVSEGLVISREGTAGRVYYRANRRKLRNIRRMLREKDQTD